MVRRPRHGSGVVADQVVRCADGLRDDGLKRRRRRRRPRIILPAQHFVVHGRDGVAVVGELNQRVKNPTTMMVHERRRKEERERVSRKQRGRGVSCIRPLLHHRHH